MSKYLNIAFLFFVLLYMLGLFYAVDFIWVLKISPIVVLGVGIYQSPSHATRPILLVALIFSGLGDLLLAFDYFIYGVAAFLFAQLSYAWIFKSVWQGVAKRWQISVLLFVYMLFMAGLLLPNLGDLTFAVMAYLLVISLMGLVAVQSSLPMRWAVLGALIFIVSDSFIAINKFIQPIPCADYWIMSSYYVAQFMLISGFIQAAKTNNHQ